MMKSSVHKPPQFRTYVFNAILFSISDVVDTIRARVALSSISPLMASPRHIFLVAGRVFFCYSILGLHAVFSTVVSGSLSYIGICKGSYQLMGNTAVRPVSLEILVACC